MERFTSVAKERSEATAQSLREKLQLDDLGEFAKFVANRSMIINFWTDFFDNVGDSDQYISRDPSTYDHIRKGVEPLLFGDSRPKYGTYDIHGQVGVEGARYGSCYFVLKEHVRQYITLTTYDSFHQKKEPVGVPDHAFHIFNFLTQRELDAVRKIFTGEIQSTHQYYCYMEIQIHGPVRFAHDIECICIPRKNADEKTVEAASRFADRFGIPLEIVPDRRNVCL